MFKLEPKAANWVLPVKIAPGSGDLHPWALTCQLPLSFGKDCILVCEVGGDGTTEVWGKILFLFYSLDCCRNSTFQGSDHHGYEL